VNVSTANRSSALERRYFVITQTEVNEYYTIQSDEKELSKRKIELRQKFLKAREAGEKFPDNGPLIIQFVDQDKADISWKEVAHGLATKLLGSSEAADQLMQELHDEAPTKPQTNVSAVANPNFNFAVFKKPARRSA
jgi:hypothetical protein